MGEPRVVALRFKACFPPTEGAFHFSARGSGMTFKLLVPEIEMRNALRLQAWRYDDLEVTVRRASGGERLKFRARFAPFDSAISMPGTRDGMTLKLRVTADEEANATAIQLWRQEELEVSVRKAAYAKEEHQGHRNGAQVNQTASEERGLTRITRRRRAGE